MKISIASPLIAEAVFLRIHALEAYGESGTVQAFHDDLEPAYGLSGEARDQAFRERLSDWSRRLTLGAPLEEAAREFEGLADRLEVHVRMPLRREKEGGEIRRQTEPGTAPEDHRYLLAIRVEPERFLDPPSLEAMTRHHLTIASDVADAGFGYDPDLFRGIDSASERQVLSERTALFLDLRAAGRVAASGRLGVRTKEAWRQLLEESLTPLPREKSELLFEAIWEGRVGRFPELLHAAEAPAEFLLRSAAS